MNLSNNHWMKWNYMFTHEYHILSTYFICNIYVSILYSEWYDLNGVTYDIPSSVSDM